MHGYQTFLAPAKVNLFLHVVGQRADGYHLLQSVFRLLDFYDTIHISPRNDGVISRTHEIPDVPEQQDLCIRAAHLLRQHTKSKLGADIFVEKRIPMGGGLGGGSSDAATVLMALNKLWDLNLSRQEMMDLGLKLGADVPFFVFGENAWVEGVGEKIQRISLSPAYYVILTPQLHVSTVEIFHAKELTRSTIPTTIAAFSRVLLNGGTGKETQQRLFHNDLEPVVCQRYPVITACLEWLNQFSQARMSGSGASVFIEVEDKAAAEQIQAQAPQEFAGIAIFSRVAKGLNHHPLYNVTV